MRDGVPLPAPARIPLRRNRDFQLLWSGQAVSVLGSQISAIAYPLLVLALTSSPALAGIVGFAGGLPNLLLPLPAGALVDRWDRRRLMIFCDVGRRRAGQPGACAVARAPVAGADPRRCICGRHARSAVPPRAAGCRAPRRACGAATQRTVPGGRADTRRRSAGPPAGGLLFGFGQLLPFLADAVSYVASLGTLLLIRSRFQEDRVAERRHMIAEIREGLVWLWNQPFLRMAAALVAASNLLFQALVLVLIVLARERGAPPSLIGLMLGGAGLGGLLGALVVIGTYRLRLTPDALRGRVASAGSMLAMGALPLGSLVGGLLIQSMGPVGASAVPSSGMLLLAVAGIVSRSVRHGPELAGLGKESPRHDDSGGS